MGNSITSAPPIQLCSVSVPHSIFKSQKGRTASRSIEDYVRIHPSVLFPSPFQTELLSWKSMSGPTFQNLAVPISNSKNPDSHKAWSCMFLHYGAVHMHHPEIFSHVSKIQYMWASYMELSLQIINSPAARQFVSNFSVNTNPTTINILILAYVNKYFWDMHLETLSQTKWMLPLPNTVTLIMERLINSHPHRQQSPLSSHK